MHSDMREGEMAYWGRGAARGAMTRTRVVIAAVIAVCVMVVVVAVVGSGNEDGPAAFLSTDDTSAIFVQWTRTGNDVSGDAVDSRGHPTQARTELFSTAPARGPAPAAGGFVHRDRA